MTEPLHEHGPLESSYVGKSESTPITSKIRNMFSNIELPTKEDVKRELGNAKIIAKQVAEKVGEEGKATGKAFASGMLLALARIPGPKSEGFRQMGQELNQPKLNVKFGSACKNLANLMRSVRGSISGEKSKLKKQFEDQYPDE